MKIIISLMFSLCIALPASAENLSRYTANELLPMAKRGVPDAHYWLGKRYETGQGVPQDLRKAGDWYIEAAELGNKLAPVALSNLAQKFLCTKDYTEAVRVLEASSDAGWADATYLLGWLYAHGRGVPRDVTQANKLYCKASKQGSPDARIKLNKTSGVIWHCPTQISWLRPSWNKFTHCLSTIAFFVGFLILTLMLFGLVASVPKYGIIISNVGFGFLISLGVLAGFATLYLFTEMLGCLTWSG